MLVGRLPRLHHRVQVEECLRDRSRHREQVRRPPTPLRSGRLIQLPEAAELLLWTARRLADHHPDPEVRQIYRQLIERAEPKREGQS